MRYLQPFAILFLVMLGVVAFSSCEEEKIGDTPLADLDLKEYFFYGSCEDTMVTKVHYVRFDDDTKLPSDTTTVYYLYTCNEPEPGFYVVGLQELYYNFLPKSFTLFEMFDNYGKISQKVDFYYPTGENVQNHDVAITSDTFYYGLSNDMVNRYSFIRHIEMDGDLDEMEELRNSVVSTFLRMEDVEYQGKTYPAIVLEEKATYETYLRGTIVEADKSTGTTYYAKGLGIVKAKADFWKTPDSELRLIDIYNAEEFEEARQAFYSNPY